MNLIQDDNIDNALSVFRSERQFLEDSQVRIPPRPASFGQGTNTKLEGSASSSPSKR